MLIENKTIDEERALYGSSELTVKNCRFDGATAHDCTYRNVDPETAAQLEAIGFTEDTTERIF